MKAVPTVEPDYTRCRALVVSSLNARAHAHDQQCRRHPTDVRQYRGQLYRVCRQHKRARYFEPWTAMLLLDPVDLVRAGFRKLEAHQGYQPPGPKLVR